MSADKRSVSTDALETLGFIHTKEEKRDAIHLAVLPVTAGEALRKGQTITVNIDGIVFRDKKGLGIVDPFLSKTVKVGESFWMVLKPRIITSLRHVWSHSEFKDEEEGTSEEEDYEFDKEEDNTLKIVSEQWLRNFCDGSDCPDYDTVIEHAIDSDGDEEIYFSGEDAHGEIPIEFWVHLKNVTGVDIKNPPEYFSCSC